MLRGVRDEPTYVDSLYSNYHVQLGNDELLLPIQPQNIMLPYPTALAPPETQMSGLVTHVDNSANLMDGDSRPHVPVIPPFHPSNFLSVPVTKRLVNVLTDQKRVRSNGTTPGRVLSELARPGSSLYEATYSGVDVYELVLGEHSLMRRRDDSWVNATHILKV